MSEPFKSLDEYRVGWWKKGGWYRYCYGVVWRGIPLVKYRTKFGHLNNSRRATLINPACDKWFTSAEYLGKELPAEEVEKGRTI